MLEKRSDETFSQHEALHVAWMLGDAFNRYVVEHPAVSGDLHAKALKVHEAMCDFYQEVGMRNSSAPPSA